MLRAGFFRSFLSRRNDTGRKGLCMDRCVRRARSGIGGSSRRGSVAASLDTLRSAARIPACSHQHSRRSLCRNDTSFLHPSKRDSMVEVSARTRATKVKESLTLSAAYCELKRSSPRHAQLRHKGRPEKTTFEPNSQQVTAKHNKRPTPFSSPWARIDQALRATDLLLQGGGFSAIVLDMGGIAPECASRVPLATWFRYRAAAEQTSASILLLTQHACAKSSAELLLRFEPGNARQNEFTVFTGIEHQIEVIRRRFPHPPANVVPLRKQPQRVTTMSWQSRTAWAGPR